MKEKIYTTLINGKSSELWISDEPEFIKECIERRIPIIEYTNADCDRGNEGSSDAHRDVSDSFLTPWAADSVDAVKSDTEYMEKVIHRFAGIPLVVAETDMLIIRELCESDAEDVERIFSEGSASGYIGIWSGDVDDRRETLRNYCSLHYDLYGYGYYGVEIKGDNAVAGIVGFREYDAGSVEKDKTVFVIKGNDSDEISLELGYVMEKKYRRKGYCVSACLELIKKIPGNIFIVVDKNNTPGLRAAERIYSQTDIFKSDSSA